MQVTFVMAVSPHLELEMLLCCSGRQFVAIVFMCASLEQRFAIAGSNRSSLDQQVLGTC